MHDGHDDNVINGGSEDLSRPTMRDVAALARVGLKTVSRVINGEPGVSPELRARVQRAIDQLDYLPNLTASSLRRSSGRSATIGLILENVANPFSSGLHRAIGDVAWARGVQVFSGSVDEDAIRERLLVSTFAGRRVDGLVVVPASHDHSYLLGHKQAGTAIVFVDRPAEFLDVDAIVSDNRGGSEEAVRHLLAVGHRRIAYLGDLATCVHRARAVCRLRPGARVRRHRRRPGHRAPRPPGQRSRRGRGRRAARLARPADRALHQPEPRHHRRGPSASCGRRPAPGRAGRLRRRPARRHAASRP